MVKEALGHLKLSLGKLAEIAEEREDINPSKGELVQALREAEQLAGKLEAATVGPSGEELVQALMKAHDESAGLYVSTSNTAHVRELFYAKLIRVLAS